jgi:hypothetical protein
MKRNLTALAVALAGLACNGKLASRRPPGQIDVRWSGSDSGSLSGAATAEWCSALRLLEIRGITGDTGFAIAIYPTDTVAAGQYPVMDPARADSSRPAGAIALRWVAQTSIKGFQGESGSVDLQRFSAGGLSGQVVAAIRSVADTQRLTIDGSFHDLPIHAAARGCAAPVKHPQADAQPPDTQLH